MYRCYKVLFSKQRYLYVWTQHTQLINNYFTTAFMSIFSVLHQLDLIVMSIALSKRFICPLFEWRRHLSITWSLFDIYTDMLLLQIKILIIPPISFIPIQHKSTNCDANKKENSISANHISCFDMVLTQVQAAFIMFQFCPYK